MRFDTGPGLRSRRAAKGHKATDGRVVAVGSSAETRSPAERAARIQASLSEIGEQMRLASRLVITVVRVFYDFFIVACLTATAIVIIEHEPFEAFVWGGTGVGLALGWVAAKQAERGVERLRRELREEWSGMPADVDRGEGHGSQRQT